MPASPWPVRRCARNDGRSIHSRRRVLTARRGDRHLVLALHGAVTAAPPLSRISSLGRLEPAPGTARAASDRDGGLQRAPVAHRPPAAAPRRPRATAQARHSTPSGRPARSTTFSEQHCGDSLKRRTVRPQPLRHPLARLVEQPAHLAVDRLCGALTERARLRQRRAVEEQRPGRASGRQAERLAHTVVRHHVARQVGSALQVVLGAGRYASSNTSCSATRPPSSTSAGRAARCGASGSGPRSVTAGVAERRDAARDDGHLGHAVGVLAELGHQCVAGLVMWRRTCARSGSSCGSSSETGDDAVQRSLEVRMSTASLPRLAANAASPR